ncbi:MAG: AAA family ATPase [Nanoarchaeota archaeon]|nr:AAA family ATPase [Nanoarchaeota archaeon]
MVENIFECIKNNIEESFVNDEFKKTFDLLENSSDSFLITGKAGTGKSTFLRFFRNKTKKRVVVVAPTGLSALNVEGQTIHSFFRLPPRVIEAKHVKKLENTSLYEKLDAIIIDEVSMVRADLLDGIDKFMRKNGKYNDLPFGGVQLIMFGDLFQLPPVTNEDSRVLNYRYDSPYFFSAYSFKDLNVKVLELENVYRQKDEDFIRVLDNIRKKELNSNALSIINSRVNVSFQPDDSFITLTPTNKLADELNNKRLNSLTGRIFEYAARFEGGLKSEDKGLPAPSVLRLKKGARVIFVKNDNNSQWVNGSLGVVDDLDKKMIIVKLDSGSFVGVERTSWDKISYKFDEVNNKVITESSGKFTQFPLKLAWALTIHKSQGQTFDKVFIDLRSGAFAHGQTYVALSRCRTLNGIVLKSPVKESDVIVDDVVTKFLNEKQLRLDE